MIYHRDEDIFALFFHRTLQKRVKLCYSQHKPLRTTSDIRLLAGEITERIVKENVAGSHWSPGILWDYLRFIERVFSTSGIAILKESLLVFYEIVDDGQIIANELISHRSNAAWVNANIEGLITSFLGRSSDAVFFDGFSRFTKKNIISQIRKDVEPGISCKEVFSRNGCHWVYPEIPCCDTLESIRNQPAEPSKKDQYIGEQQSSLLTIPTSLKEAVQKLTTSSTNSSRSSFAHSEASQGQVSSTGTPASIFDSYEVVQIRLRGPSLKAAWLTNAAAYAIPVPDDGFDPQSDAEQGAYLGGHDHTELAEGTGLQASYWPLRALIWSLFTRQMSSLSILPKPELKIVPGVCIKGEVYHGIVLSEFEFSTVKNLRRKVFSQDQVEAWAMKTHIDLDEPLSDYWGRPDMIKIHQAGDIAPDLLDAPDLSKTQQAFVAWMQPRLMQSPMWRLGIHGQAVRQLETTLVRQYVISFEQTPALWDGGQQVE